MKTALVLGDELYQNLLNCWEFSVLTQLDFEREEMDVSDVDLVVFTGGTDINPKLYGEKRSYYTGLPNIDRDEYEVELFNLCVKNGIPMYGICRGFQLLSVLNGAKLFQQVSGHGWSHSVTTKEGEEFIATSTHHQMVYIPDNKELNYELLAWSTNSLSDYCLTGTGVIEGVSKEVEAIWWPETKCVGTQFHPEYTDEDSAERNITREWIRRYLDV